MSAMVLYLTMFVQPSHQPCVVERDESRVWPNYLSQLAEPYVRNMARLTKTASLKFLPLLSALPATDEMWYANVIPPEPFHLGDTYFLRNPSRLVHLSQARLLPRLPTAYCRCTCSSIVLIRHSPCNQAFGSHHQGRRTPCVLQEGLVSCEAWPGNQTASVVAETTSTSVLELAVLAACLSVARIQLGS